MWLHRSSLKYIAFAFGRIIYISSVHLARFGMACSLDRQINLKRVCAPSMLNSCVIDNIYCMWNTHTLVNCYKIFIFVKNELVKKLLLFYVYDVFSSKLHIFFRLWGWISLSYNHEVCTIRKDGRQAKSSWPIWRRWENFSFASYVLDAFSILFLRRLATVIEHSVRQR